MRARACVRVRACACVRACVSVCVGVCVIGTQRVIRGPGGSSAPLGQSLVKCAARRQAMYQLVALVCKSETDLEWVRPHLRTIYAHLGTALGAEDAVIAMHAQVCPGPSAVLTLVTTRGSTNHGPVTDVFSLPAFQPHLLPAESVAHLTDKFLELALHSHQVRAVPRSTPQYPAVLGASAALAPNLVAAQWLWARPRPAACPRRHRSHAPHTNALRLCRARWYPASPCPYCSTLQYRDLL